MKRIKYRHLLIPCSIVLGVFPCQHLSSAEDAVAELPLSEPVGSESMFNQARAHLNGQGVRRDPQKAFELMNKAAAQGHAEASGGVGYFYANGVAVEMNEALAVEWFRKGAAKGGARSQYNLGRMLIDGKGVAKNQQEGRAWIERSATQGVAEAAYSLGSMYYFGDTGVAKDLERAFPLLLEAAEKEHLDAQNTVGVMLCEGIGVERDEEKGIRWYRKAAISGHVKAQSNLGRMLGPTNRSPEKDPAERVEGLTWCIVASKQGDVMAVKVMEDALPSIDEAELSEARRKAAALLNDFSSQAGVRKIVPAGTKKAQPSTSSSEADRQ